MFEPFIVAVMVAVLQAAAVQLPLTITVPAARPWVDTGLTVTKGQRLTFKTDGTIRWGTGPGETAGPQGTSAKPGKLGKGGLIGRVGFSGKPFPIGAATDAIAMPKSGKLFLGINDFLFGDNSGAFTVTIEPAPADGRREAAKHSAPTIYLTK